ncbi:MAG: primosomal protein N' [Oscillospiraceae bacterium]|nr:primosomal protein N' [Oscillospiraceae bacterium]
MIVLVGVSGTSYAFDSLYSYTAPDDSGLLPGMRVIVPFGRGNRRRVGIVVRVSEGAPNGENPFDDGGSLNEVNYGDNSHDERRQLKEIAAVADKEPILGDEQLSLLCWLKDTTFCTYYEALGALIPPGLGISFTARYKLTGKKPKKGQVSAEAMGLYASAAEAEGCIDMLIASDPKAAEELREAGFLEETDVAKQRVGDDTVSMVRLTERYSEDMKLTPKQGKAAEVLLREGCASVKELTYLCGCSSSVIMGLVKSGAAEIFREETLKVPEIGDMDDISDIVLSSAQREAYEGIEKLCDEGKPSAALLYGVTGSGKTLVFAKLMERTLKQGRGVLLLIPEIALTPQTVNRFRRLFGETVAVMHSGLSLSMRSNEYKRIKAGQCRIVVGTRSAVFAPMENIGLIIMDEEGERSYKSGQNPRYHARDAAARRCLYHKAVLLMASATPSIESFYGAASGKIKLFRLSERYSPDEGAAPSLPEVKIIDMTGSGKIFSSELIRELKSNLQKGEQSLLLLNRRGYHTYVSCMECRQPVSCPNCEIPMTYHRVNGRLICHYCGYSEDFTGRCGKCGGGLRSTGMGTQRLEEEIAEFLPDARILRMDADTTYSRYAYDKRFTAFGNGEYDIMVGTQMIAKGLDFPKVTLVGVLNADKTLFSGDYRSFERTFSLITQVVGRSGRSGGVGRAYIQTFVPDHYVINLAAAQDYDSFYEQETAMRKAMIYPPFCDICCVGFSGTRDKKVEEAAAVFAAALKEKIPMIKEKMPIRILGPSKCEFEKIGGRYRYRIIIKCRNNGVFREFIGGVRRETAKLPEFRGITVFMDINGDIF